MQDVRHRSTFYDRFKKSPQDFHAELAFPKGAQCAACGRPPTVRAIVMAPLDEARKHGYVPRHATLQMLSSVLVPLKTGSGVEHFVRTNMAYSCLSCRAAFEKVLAKSVPSWCCVEINDGPKERIVVGVA
jgi:hypothetical protein